MAILMTMFLKKIMTTAVAVLASGAAVITGGGPAVRQIEGKPSVEKDTKPLVAEEPGALTPEDAIRAASDSELAKEFNTNQPPVEFKVEFVSKAILVQVAGGAEWDKGHGPGDVGLGARNPAGRKQARFLAILTADVIKQLNKAGVTDTKKHFQGRTIRVKGAISWCAYDGFGTPPEVEVVVDDLSHLEVMD